MLAAWIVLSQPPLETLLAAPALRGASVSVCVRDLEGQVLLEHDSARRLIPASNQKLLTGAFALYALGPDFRPRTRIWKTPHRTYVESEGDPLMTRARLQEAVQRLKLNDKLPVWVKQSYLPLWPDTWEFDDLPNRYAAPVSAFTVDRGGIELWADEGKLKLEPDSYGIKLRWWPGKADPTVVYDPFKREVRVVGRIPQGRRRLDTFSLPRPDEAAASVLGAYAVPTDRVPTGPPTGILEGNTAAEMVLACLPPSDNNIAENLFLMAAQRLNPLPPRPYPVARAEMTRFLTRVVGIAEEDVNVMDGSGMSRHNLITTRGMTQLLLWTAKQPTADVWRASLARPGAGTLADRLAGVEFSGKTGTLNMVVGLSGFLRAKSGKEVAVSVLMNAYPGTSRDARNAADTFVRSLAEAL